MTKKKRCDYDWEHISRKEADSNENFFFFVGLISGIVIGILIFVFIIMNLINTYDPYDFQNDWFCQSVSMEYDKWEQKCIEYTDKMEKIEYDIKEDDNRLYLKRRY